MGKNCQEDMIGDCHPERKVNDKCDSIRGQHGATIRPSLCHFFQPKNRPGQSQSMRLVHPRRKQAAGRMGH